MPVVAVIDTNVLRYALEAEKNIRSDKETATAYEVLVKLLSSDTVVLVLNEETAKEYSRHIEAVRREIRRKRIHPQFFQLLRAIKAKSRKVASERHEFNIKGESVGRKDFHLLNSAKTGALKFKTKKAFVLTFAQDVYRGEEARNGEGVVVYLLNLRDENERKRLEELL